jgi:hypothetical protein
MRIIGCDLHARQQTLAMLDTTTGEVEEVTLKHEGNNVREFYFPIHHNRHVPSGGKKLHHVPSFACHLRPSRFRVGILFQPSENLKSTRFNRRFAAVLIGYFSFG